MSQFRSDWRPDRNPLLARVAQANAIRETQRTSCFRRLKGGAVPICSSPFCADHLRPLQEKAGDVIPDGHRWGLHNLRHSLSNWLVNKAKENPKRVSGILGHSRIQTTLDLYTDEDLDEMIAAREKFLDAVGIEAGSVQ